MSLEEFAGPGICGLHVQELILLTSIIKIIMMP